MPIESVGHLQRHVKTNQARKATKASINIGNAFASIPISKPIVVKPTRLPKPPQATIKVGTTLQESVILLFCQHIVIVTS